MKKRLKGLLALVMAGMLLIGTAGFTASAATGYTLKNLSVTTEMYPGDRISSSCGWAFYVVNKGLASDGVSPYYYYSERMNTPQNGADTAAFSTYEAADQFLSNPETASDRYLYQIDSIFTLPDNLDGYYKYKVSKMEAYSDTGYTGDCVYYIDPFGSANTVTRATGVLVVEEIPCTYTVSFNANGGEGSMTNYSGTYDPNNCNLPANTFKRTGYTFAGWNTKSDGTGKTYADNASYVPTKNEETVTLYAQWTENSCYNVIYDTDGGNEITPKLGINWTGKVLDGKSNPVKAGYTFDGWVDTVTNATVNADTRYCDIDTKSDSDYVLLKAKWVERSDYTITFYLDDSLEESKIYKTKENVKWTDNVLADVKDPEMAGFVFVSWYYDGFLSPPDVEIKSTDTFETFGKKFINTPGIAVYATWEKVNSYTVTFDSNGGSAVDARTGVTWDGLVLTTDVSDPVRAGYRFDGWYLGETKAQADTKYGDIADAEATRITLKAKWTDIEAPVISGIENGATYCEGKTFTVSDNDGIASVSANGVGLVSDSTGKYTLDAANGEVVVVATDRTGNSTTVTVTVNEHNYCIAQCTECGAKDPNACCLLKILRYIINWLTAFIKSCIKWTKEMPISLSDWFKAVFGAFC